MSNVCGKLLYSTKAEAVVCRNEREAISGQPHRAFRSVDRDSNGIPVTGWDVAPMPQCKNKTTYILKTRAQQCAEGLQRITGKAHRVVLQNRRFQVTAK